MRWPSPTLIIAGVVTGLVLFHDGPRLRFEALALAMGAHAIRDNDLHDHMLDHETYRCADQSCAVPSLFYEILIDRNGQAVDARIVSDLGPDRRLRNETRALLLSRRYRSPTTADPSARGARLLQMLEIIPPVRVPRRQVPFPPYDPATVRVTLERGPCFGGCPTYRVTMQGDGSVRYDEPTYGGPARMETSSVDPAEVRRLVEAFEAADFLSLDDVYSSGWVDHSIYKLTLEIGGLKKTVVDDDGPRGGMPDSVRTLEDAVDRVAGTSRWISAPQPW